MSAIDELSQDLRAEGFDVLGDVGPAALRVGADRFDASDFAVYQFGASVCEDRGVWTIYEPNAAWLRVRSRSVVVEFLVRLRSIRRSERAREDIDQSARRLTEAEVQLRASPCLRCKSKFQFRPLAPRARSRLMDLTLRLPGNRRKIGVARAIRELRKVTECSVVDAKGIHDHLAVMVGDHPLERRQHCHHCDANLLDECDFQDCGQCGALNLML